MDRRDFLKTAGAAGGMATGLTTLLGAAGAGQALAAHHEGAAAPKTEASKAMHGLLETIRQVEAQWLRPEMGLDSPELVAEAERAIAHILWTGLNHFLEADPDRPVFTRYVTADRKLLGCNPDSIYYFAPLRDDRSYRGTGTIGAATFTSFTLEQGSDQGRGAKGSTAALSDTDMEIASDGSYEIHVGPKAPKRGNWLRSTKGVSQITTRHYHEAQGSVAATPERLVPLHIEPLDPDPVKRYGGDAYAAERLNWVANYVRDHCAMTFGGLNPKARPPMGWVSTTPNVFTDPGQWASAAGDNAYGNTHAWYAMAPFRLAADEALVITGRFPACRFANVVLWNDFMQAFEYRNHRCSLNRNQVVYEKDGSFRMVIAHRDPGVPNWIDTTGHLRGGVLWRFVSGDGVPEPATVRVVPTVSVAQGVRESEPAR